MTFLEAAIEILRRESGPLPVAKITQRAVEDKLLSHVGRDPEAAMRSCLNSATRGTHPLVERPKPGTFQIRPGAQLPEAPPVETKEVKEIKQIEPVEPAQPADPAPAKQESEEPQAAEGQGADSSSADDGAESSAAANTEESSPPPRTRRGRRGSRGRGNKAEATPEAKPVEALSNGKDDQPAADPPSPNNADADDVPVEFNAPDGSGLEGVTDVALVMANAMSRLADERPELREELEAMQQRQQQQEEQSAEVEDGPGRGRREEMRPRLDQLDERNGRRRRRRRRRGRKVDTTILTSHRASSPGRSQLLSQVESVLAENSSRSLHVRQVAEMLAAKNVLGGEISEIERVVTSALILDVSEQGTASRFVLRGDARYQLRAGRVPEAAATAETALRKAARNLELQTEEQLAQWCSELGARALESLVRVYLAKEQFRIMQSLPPARGIARLVGTEADEPDVKAMVFIVPRKAKVDIRQLETELDRQGCDSVTVIAMGDTEPFTALEDARVIDPRQLSEQLMRHGIAVETVTYRVPVLNSAVIESIGGLDT